MNRCPAFERQIVLLAASLLSTLPAMAQETKQPATEQARKWVVYLLPHSHIDIGYPDIMVASVKPSNDGRAFVIRL